MKKLILLIAIIVSYSCDKPEVSYESENFKVVKLADGVFACIHKLGGKAVCNSGIIDNGRETIIFDTFLSPNAAKELFEVVSFYELSPIKFVVNSHFHNDHIRGNQVFGKDVEIISTTRTKELIDEREPEQLLYEEKFAPARLAYYDSLYNAYSGDSTDSEFIDIQMWRPYYQILVNSTKEIRTILPNSFVDSIRVISGVDRDIHLISRGAGHTESDLILYLPQEGILFSGDLFFHDCHPYMADGDAREWISYLEYMSSLKPKIVIPGHGEIGAGEDLIEMKGYIVKVEEIIEKMVREGKTRNDIDSVKIPERYRDWLFDRFFNYNLSGEFSKKIGSN